MGNSKSRNTSKVVANNQPHEQEQRQRAEREANKEQPQSPEPREKSHEVRFDCALSLRDPTAIMIIGSRRAERHPTLVCILDCLCRYMSLCKEAVLVHFA